MSVAQSAAHTAGVFFPTHDLARPRIDPGLFFGDLSIRSLRLMAAMIERERALVGGVHPADHFNAI